MTTLKLHNKKIPFDPCYHARSPARYNLSFFFFPNWLYSQENTCGAVRERTGGVACKEGGETETGDAAKASLGGRKESIV
jgi:hypothetical protein